MSHGPRRGLCEMSDRPSARVNLLELISGIESVLRHIQDGDLGG
jgi:hypothetical protein